MLSLAPARLLPFLFLLAACGGVTASGVDAGSGSGTPDAAPSTPDGPPTSCAADGDACSLAAGVSLCSGGTCAACLDDVDNFACAAAYGPGTTCTGGRCVPPACTAPADCGGQDCVGGQCVACQRDNDCASNETCDTTTGVCAAAAGLCASKSVGDACGPAGGNLCCDRPAGLSCVDVACCGTGTGHASCPSLTDSCQAGVCVPAASGCTAPPDGEYWVDPGYGGVRTGSKACPFITLGGAFDGVRNDSVAGATTIYVKGTINGAGEGAGAFPLSVPITAYVRNWPGVADAIVVAPANTTVFEARYTDSASATGWSARLSHLEIKQASGGGTAGAGIDVTGGSMALPIHVDHVDIHGCFNGINVGGGGAADLDWGVNAHDNRNDGLLVNGGRVDMAIGLDADARSHFDHNLTGIQVSSDPTSILVVTGAKDPTTNLETVTASGNTGAGLSVAGPNATNAVTHLGMVGDDIGLVVYGGAKLKLRRANIQTNRTGISVRNNGTATSLAGIDLGVLADQGFNSISDSTDSHVCMTSTPDTTALRAEGNTFGSVDCSVATPSAQVRMFRTCAGHNGGFNDAAPSFRESVANCTFAVQ